MASQEDQSASNQLPTFGASPHAELLSSKFLRKTKFRRKSGVNFQPETSSAPDEAAGLEGEPPASALVEETPGSPYSPEKKLSDNPGTGSDASSTASTPKEATEEPAPPLPSISSPSDATSARSPPLSNASSTPANELAVPIASSPTVTSPQSASTETDSASGTIPLSFTLSPEELDQAKILVLDLLGWGVDAEYLVTSGVSPAVIFRVFTDLNLQLPTNLEVSDELTAVAYSWGPLPDFSKSIEPNSLVVE